MFYLYYLLYKLTNNDSLWIIRVYDNYQDIIKNKIRNYMSKSDAYLLVKRQFYISKDDTNNKNNTKYHYSWNSFSNKFFKDNSTPINYVNTYNIHEIYDTYDDNVLTLRKKKMIQDFIEDELNIKSFNKFILNEDDDIIIQESIIL